MNFDYGIADTPLNAAVKKRLEEHAAEPERKPNRAQRRAMERAQRAAQRRGQRAYDREQARKAAELRKIKAEVAALTDEERAQLAQVIQEREARAARDHEKVVADIEAERLGTPDASEWPVAGYMSEDGIQR